MKHHKNMRKEPLQDRSADTVDVIVEATTQILDTEGDASITTNHIAERAGVSVGSLYRYFSNKQDILHLIVTREAARQESHLTALISAWAGQNGDDLIREIAVHSLKSFQGRGLVRRSLHKYLQQKDTIAAELHALRCRILLRLEEKLTEEYPSKYRMLQEDERHALLGAWAGVLNALTLYSKQSAQTSILVDQLVELVTTYLAKDEFAKNG